MRVPHGLFPVMTALILVAYGFTGQEQRMFPLAGPWRPLFGFEHGLAAVGVGGWGIILRGHAVWALPAAFLVGVGAGYAVAWDGRGELPFVGLNLLLSVLVLTLVTLLPVRVPIGIAAALVSILGLYHGYAYGWEARIIEAALTAGSAKTV